jgi:hypothetical protein
MQVDVETMDRPGVPATIVEIVTGAGVVRRRRAVRSAAARADLCGLLDPVDIGDGGQVTVARWSR